MISLTDLKGFLYYGFTCGISDTPLSRSKLTVGLRTLLQNQNSPFEIVAYQTDTADIAFALISIPRQLLDKFIKVILPRMLCNGNGGIAPFTNII